MRPRSPVDSLPEPRNTLRDVKLPVKASPAMNAVTGPPEEAEEVLLGLLFAAAPLQQFFGTQHIMEAFAAAGARTPVAGVPASLRGRHILGAQAELQNPRL